MPQTDNEEVFDSEDTLHEIEQATKQLSASELSPTFRRKARPPRHQRQAQVRHQRAEDEAEAYRQTVLKTKHRSANMNLDVSKPNQQDKPTNHDESTTRGQPSREEATVRQVGLRTSITEAREKDITMAAQDEVQQRTDQSTQQHNGPLTEQPQERSQTSEQRILQTSSPAVEDLLAKSALIWRDLQAKDAAEREGAAARLRRGYPGPDHNLALRRKLREEQDMEEELRRKNPSVIDGTINLEDVQVRSSNSISREVEKAVKPEDMEVELEEPRKGELDKGNGKTHNVDEEDFGLYDDEWEDEWEGREAEREAVLSKVDLDHAIDTLPSNPSDQQRARVEELRAISEQAAKRLAASREEMRAQEIHQRFSGEHSADVLIADFNAAKPNDVPYITHGQFEKQYGRVASERDLAERGALFKNEQGYQFKRPASHSSVEDLADQIAGISINKDTDQQKKKPPIPLAIIPRDDGTYIGITPKSEDPLKAKKIRELDRDRVLLKRNDEDFFLTANDFDRLYKDDTAAERRFTRATNQRYISKDRPDVLVRLPNNLGFMCIQQYDVASREPGSDLPTDRHNFDVLIQSKNGDGYLQPHEMKRQDTANGTKHFEEAMRSAQLNDSLADRPKQIVPVVMVQNGFTFKPVEPGSLIPVGINSNRVLIQNTNKFGQGTGNFSTWESRSRHPTNPLTRAQGAILGVHEQTHQLTGATANGDEGSAARPTVITAFHQFGPQDHPSGSSRSNGRMGTAGLSKGDSDMDVDDNARDIGLAAARHQLTERNRDRATSRDSL